MSDDEQFPSGALANGAAMSAATVIDMVPPPTPKGDTPAAVGFLRRLHGDDPWIVITIDPETKATVRRDFPPGETDKARAFIDAAQGRLNCYTPVNRAAPGGTSPKKEQMLAARALWVDADLHDTGGEPEALLVRLRSFDPPPSMIIFSGGGYWPLWLLAEPYDKGDDWRERVEKVSRGLHRAAGASPTCATINRLMRLPGTVNVPDETKRLRGRVPTLAEVVEADWSRRWSFGTDPLPSLPSGEAEPSDGGDGRDGSRSGTAWRKGLEMHRAGASYEEFVAAVKADPETSDWAREKGEAHGGRELKKIWDKAPATTPGNTAAYLSEQWLALEFVAKHCDELRYTAKLKMWHLWDGQRWAEDLKLRTFSLAQELCRRTPTPNPQAAMRLNSANTRAAVVSLSRENPTLAVTHDHWDTDIWIFETPNEGFVK